jgi:crotonobetaine/carnitine-CoA ligase
MLDQLPTVRESDTVLHALQRAVSDVPDQVFLDFGGDLYTYAEVDRLSTRFARSLAGLGVGSGHTVATVLDNNIDQILTWLAVNKLGAIWVPLNTAYRGDFLRHQLDDSLARLVISETAYVPAVLDVAGEVPNLQMLLVRGDSSAALKAPSGLEVKPLDQHRGSDESPFELTAKPGDLAFLMYTSGTTGVSKGCTISHNFICQQAQQSNLAVPPLPGEVMYTCLPLFHMAAVDTTTSALISQSRIAISERFSVSTFWSEIERSGAGNARLMAAIFPLLANAPDSEKMKRCFGQLRAVTGVPISPEVRKVWHERFGVEYLNSFAYGQTEGVRLSMSRLGEPTPPETSCGPIASDYYEVVILDDHDLVVPDGGVGEIAFRPRKAHGMFEGYWRRPEETLQVWRNMWMHTGDLGRIEDGCLFFVDRKKDYLRSRGENISSFEVERSFLRHPDLAEVAVHSVSTGIAEDCLKVTAVLAPGAQLTEEELCRWALDHVPYFAVPRYIEFRSELAKTPTGKVMKYQLRDEGQTPSTWDREAAGIVVRRR